MTPEQNEKFKKWAMGYFEISEEQWNCAHDNSFYLKLEDSTLRCNCCDYNHELTEKRVISKAAWMSALK